MAPTEPKCGNKKCWLRRLRIGQKCDDGDGRPAPHSQSTDEINAGKERRMLQLGQECMRLLGWFPRGLTLLVPRSTALSSLLPHGRECLAMRAPQLLAHIPTFFCSRPSLRIPLKHPMQIIYRYFVPEDGDSEAHPNVFLAPKAAHPGAPPTLGQIRGAFPLPGSYHFRFKSPLVPGADRDKSSMAVWMDCTDDRQPVTTWRGTIIAKVTRISADDGYDTDEEFDMHRTQAGGGAAAAAAPAQQQRAAAAPPAPAADPSLDLFDAPATARAPAAAAASSGDLLGVHSAAPPAAAGAPAGGSLLDMTGPPSGGHHQSAPGSAHHNDFMGMTASATAAQQQPPQQQAPMQGQPMRQTMPPPQQQQQQAYRTQSSFGSQQQQQGGGGTFGDLQWQ